jgi:hypothetical protein
LPDLFSTCIDGFEYIQPGKQFGKDYGKCLLRLDASKFQLSRGAESVGLTHSESAERYKAFLSQQEYDLAYSLLEQIRDSFNNMETSSAKYGKHTKIKDPESASLVVYDATRDLAPQSRICT